MNKTFTPYYSFYRLFCILFCMAFIQNSSGKSSSMLTDTSPPQITYTALRNSSALTRTLTAVLTDETGVNAAVLHYKKGEAGTYHTVTGNMGSGTSMDGSWSFVIDHSVAGATAGDTIYYFVAAQDVLSQLGSEPAGALGSDPNNISTYPATPSKYVIVSSISGTFMIGASQTAPHYTSITQALNDIATRELTSSVTLLLQGDYNAPSEASFPLTFKPFLSTNPAFTVTLKPDAGVNAVIYGSSPTSILQFTDNAKNYIVDGSNNGTASRNLFIANTTAPGAVVIFEGLFDNQGVKNCTLKNTVIKGASNSTNFIGVLIGSYVNSQGTGGKGHENITLSNNNIYNCNEAIIIRGTSSSVKVKRITIEGNQIGTDSSGLSIRSYGVLASHADSLVINNNRIYNFRSAGVRMGGVWFDQHVTNSAIRSNIITGINSTATSGVYSAYGINFESTGNSNDSIINNSISDISTQISATPTSAIAAGIRVAQTASNLKVYFNSIYLSGQTSAATSIAFLHTPINIFGMDIRNNIFSNEITGATAAKHYAVRITAPVSAIPFDYNVLSANTPQGILMYQSGAEYNSINEIRTNTSSNLNSRAADPLFNGFNNLVPKPGSPALLAGTTIPGLLVDIKNVTRGTSPTIGAYETAADISGPTITYTKLPNTTSFNNFTTTSFAAITDISGVDVNQGTKPRLYYKKHSDANVFGPNNSAASGWKWVESASSASPFDFTFDYSLLSGGAVAAGDSVFYFVIAQDLLGQVNDIRGLRAASVSAITSAPDKADAFIIVGPPLTGTYTVGNGGTYATLTRAATDIYLRGLQGDVTLEIVSNITEPGPIVIEQWKEFGAGNYRLDILPSAANAAGDTIFSTVASRGVLELQGADRVTIDGRMNGAGNFLTFVNNATTNTQYGIRLMSRGINIGATDNVIRNVNVRLNNTIVPSAAAIISEGDNNHNLKIQHNNISRAGSGIYITATNFPAGNHMGVIISDNKIGGSGNQDNIGTIGVFLTYTPEVQVMRNHIFNVNGAQFAGSIGIQLGAYTSKANISQNKIHDIVNSYYDAMFREAGQAAGISINSPTTTDEQLIANNVIYRVTNASFISNHNTQNPFGIYIGGGNAHRIIHNSVYLYGTTVAPSNSSNATLAAALMINTASKNLIVQNNIFANGFKGNPGSKIYSVYANANSSFASIENNNYDTTGADSLGYIGFKGNNALTLDAWRALTEQDQSSVCVLTPFTSLTDLSINSGSSPTALESGALLLTNVNTDFNDEARPKTLPTTYNGNTAPDIGAYEFDGAIADIVAPVIQYTVMPKITYSTTSQTITAIITDQGTGVNIVAGTKPRIYYKKMNDANTIAGNTSSDNGWKYTETTSSASPFSFTIDYSILNGGTAAVNDTIQYFIAAQDMATTPHTGANPGKGFVAVDVNTITVLPTNPGFYFISNPALNGVYTVGSAVSNSYHSITAALSDLAIRGVSGPVVFELTDAEYSSAETFPLVIPEIAGASATSTVTIRPATGVSPIIYGNAQDGILKISDKVQHFILDGSNSAGNTRDLMINNGSSLQAPVIRFEGLSITGGVKNVVVKNTRIKGGSSANGIGIFIGGATVNLSSAGTGEGYDNISIINNNIYACNAALVANGGSTSKVKHLLVINNEIGTDTVGLYNRQCGVYLRNTDNALISKNRIFNQKTTDGVNCSGIEILEGISNSMIGQNTITGIHTTNISGYGAYGINVSTGVNVSNDSICNNMISDLLTSNSSVNSTSANAFGIRINGGDGLKIFHNTVNLSGQPVTGNAASASAALLIINNGYPNSDIRNNILTNSMTGAVAGSKHYAFWTTIAPLSNTVFNHNNFYVSGTHGILMNRIGTDVNTLAELKAATAANANSKNVDVNYTSPTDLRLTGSSNGDVAFAGTPIVSVNYDIDNNARSATHPYMGAHEASIPLPVRLLSFKAILQDEDVLLSWTTASEINNKGFIVERSADNRTFERIGFEKGAGNSNVTRNYMYSDVGAFSAENRGSLYYRLVQTDLNGAETRSEVQLVTRQVAVKDVIEAYPNPFNTIVHVRIPESYKGAVEVTDIQGRVVLKEVVPGVNQDKVISLNLEHLHAGVYFLNVIGADHKIVKLIKGK